MNIRLASALIVAVSLAACGRSETPAPQAEAPPAPVPPATSQADTSAIATALANPSRFAGDAADDTDDAHGSRAVWREQRAAAVTAQHEAGGVAIEIEIGDEHGRS